ncbi:MAG: iron-sulfur cluster co-chaperone HscB C-terminal domain-containing protein [Chitinophagaceae bacterium]
MNYFELFDIPVSFMPPMAIVRKKFYELSRKYHPDFFSQASNHEQAIALETSAAINKAYKIFNSKEATIQYVLQLKGLLEDDEKYQLPSDFLMEVMDINEIMVDAKGENKSELIEKANKQLAILQDTIYENIQPILEHFEEGVTSEKELLQVKKYYFQKKYLDRILASS